MVTMISYYRSLIKMLQIVNNSSSYTFQIIVEEHIDLNKRMLLEHNNLIKTNHLSVCPHRCMRTRIFGFQLSFVEIKLQSDSAISITRDNISVYYGTSSSEISSINLPHLL